MSRPLRAVLAVAIGLALLLASLAVAVLVLNLGGELPVRDRAAEPPDDPDRIRRGAYLALAGNCAGCHSSPGEPAYAGGRGIETPFGTVFASNLTPDVATGIGTWSSSAFWRALHDGRSRDGRLLYPVFPYPNYTGLTRADADDLLAWLRTLPPVRRPNTPPALRFPYDSRAALAIWRALYFRPATDRADDGLGPTPRPAARGAYLVDVLGHCSACHAPRNRLGATDDAPALGGGLIPMQNWYAPSLADPAEAGVAHWPIDAVVRLLRDGVAPGASVLGPMAEVVHRSTQHLTPEDLVAIATHLRSLPAPAERAPRAGRPADASTLDEGRRIYADHCSHCHGADGEGIPGAYPALAGNRAVAIEPPANLIHAVREGGFPPATAGNPRPFGMPPFATVLNDREIAAVLTLIRNSWGHRASAVDPVHVRRFVDPAR